MLSDKQFCLYSISYLMIFLCSLIMKSLPNMWHHSCNFSRPVFHSFGVQSKREMYVLDTRQCATFMEHGFSWTTWLKVFMLCQFGYGILILQVSKTEKSFYLCHMLVRALKSWLTELLVQKFVSVTDKGDMVYTRIRIYFCFALTLWGRVTHICVSILAIIGSDNGLSPGRCQAIIWTNAGILLIRTLGTNFSEILGEIHSFSLKMHLKMSSAKWRLFGLGLNELIRGTGHHLITVTCNKRHDISIHPPRVFLFNSFKMSPKKYQSSASQTLAHCERNPSVTGEFPSQRLVMT